MAESATSSSLPHSYLESGPDNLPLGNGFSQAAAVRADGPRFLRFLARRADEQRPGAPDIAVAASDLATALEYEIGERGAGNLIEVLKRAYQSDDSRRRKVLGDYRRIRNRGVNSRENAMAMLPAPSKLLAAQRPSLQPEIGIDGEMLVSRLGRAGAPVRLHVRVLNHSREMVERIDNADLEVLPLLRLGALGHPGDVTISLEAVASIPPIGATWPYGETAAEIVIPAVAIDFEQVERALIRPNGTTYQTKRTKSFWQSFTDFWRGRQAVLDDAREQIEQAPPHVGRAAVLLSERLTEPFDKAEAVEKLIQRRRLVA